MFSIKTKAIALFFIIISVFTLILGYFTGIVKPILLNKCEASLRIFIQDTINSSIAEAVNYELFTDLIRFSYSPDGKICAYSTDMLASARLRAAIGKGISDKVKEEKQTLLKLNMGILSGIPFLFNYGPSLDVIVDGFSYSEINVSSEFLDAGINQTLHKLYLEAKAVSSVKAPFFSEKIVTETKIPISETVLIGDVPEAYTVIIRAHEEDEEDINDYAANLEN